MDKEFLKEDGYLNVQNCTDIYNIIFHPNLNVILIFTKTQIYTLDINSGIILLSGNCTNTREEKNGNE
jgi:hypothetical protein